MTSISISKERERLDLKNDEPICHIADWYEGDPPPKKALCGKELKGIPGRNEDEVCVVCLDIMHGQGVEIEPW